MNLVDNHSHSNFSVDSRMDIDDAVRTAKAKGLGGIVFSDHLDFDPPEGVKIFTFDVPTQQKTLEEHCQYLGVSTTGCPREDAFMVMKGVEIGLQMKSMGKIRDVMKNNSFDSVIASQHLIDDCDPYYGGYYDTLDYKTAYGHYLEEFYKGIVEFGDFDILGHYDYVVRYADYPQVMMSYSEFGDVIDMILKYLVEHGKTFEINTKTYQLYGKRHPELDINILKRFKELGGEALSFGSDAHDTFRIAEKFDWCRECALKAGIEYEVFFSGRKPHFVKL